MSRVPTRAACGRGGRLATAIGVAWALLAAAACPGDGARGDRAVCTSDAQCKSGLCYPGRCRAPEADDDGDGLSNAAERDLRSDPDRADSDGDGLLDGGEVGADPAAPRDSDGDGRPDVLESIIADVDLDCLADQLDPDDAHPETDLQVVARASCRTRGVCAPSGLVTATCLQIAIDGTLTSELTCDYGSVPGFDGNIELRCDGLDNDCDGPTDEDLGYLDGDGTLLPLGAACAGTGSCAAHNGVVECSSSEKAVCSVNRGGSAFAGANSDLACDATDNDCDGQTDEGVSWTNPTTGGVRLFGQACVARGVCGLAAGVVECEAGTTDGICSTEPGASDDHSAPEVCDGADNDCDGLTDEGLRWDAGAGAALPLGADCGTGACAGGAVVCGASGKAVCSTQSNASDGLERCDGRDDDCDGATDEPEGLALGCPSVGVCAALTLAAASCDEDGALRCDFAPTGAYAGAVEAACDGRDDDCDGATDEDFVTAGGLAVGSPCAGQGGCAGAGGFVVCAADGRAAVCSTDLYGAPEACDGLDNDCDGATDEPDLALPGGGVCATVGVCAGAAAPRCVEARWSCAYEGEAAWQPVEALCDGRDNDCDGETDEGLPRAPTGEVARGPGIQPPARRSWPSAAQEGALWLFGGVAVASGDAAAPPRLLDDLWRYDAASRAWTALDAPGGLAPRAGHAVTWWPDRGVLIVHGGFTTAVEAPAPWYADGAPDAGMWVFDPAANRWAAVTQEPPVDGDFTAIARRGHAIAPSGPGRLLLHGGWSLAEAGPGTAVTAALAPGALVGSLSAEPLADGTLAWRCAWTVLEEAPPWRAGHRLVADVAGPGLVVLGGVGAGEGRGPAGLGAAFGAAWSGAAAAPWLSFEVPVGATATHGRAPVAGLRAGTLTLAQGAGSWRRALPDGAWEPLGGEPGAALGPLCAAAGGDWLLLEADGVGAAGRRTWRLAAGAASWSLDGRWAGPEPRVKPTLAVDVEGGAVRLFGGRRADGSALGDVWRLDAGASQWKAEYAPSPALASTGDGFVGALALWDASLGRAILVGGAANAGRLRVYLPGTAAADATPATLGAGTSVVALARDPAGDAAWLVVTDAAGKVAVFRLDLDTLGVSPWGSGAAGAPVLASGPVAAGAVAGALVVVAVEAGQPTAWRLVLDGTGWVPLPFATTAPGLALSPSVALWDEAGRAALMLAPGASGGQAWRVDPIAATVAAVALGAATPAEAAWAVAPGRGVLGFGGRDLSSTPLAVTWQLPDACVGP